MYGFSPLCSFMWLFRAHFSLKERSHNLHSNFLQEQKRGGEEEKQDKKEGEEEEREEKRGKKTYSYLLIPKLT